MQVSRALLTTWLLLASSVGAGRCKDAAPTATVKNGTYAGVRNAKYGQDFFLGMPFAQVCLVDHCTLPEPWTPSGLTRS
jgi:hypothetical protein